MTIPLHPGLLPEDERLLEQVSGAAGAAQRRAVAKTITPAGVHARRPPRPRRCAAQRPAGLHRALVPPGREWRAGRRQEHLHRGAGPVPARPRPPRGGAGGGPPAAPSAAAASSATRRAWSACRCRSRPTSAPAPPPATWAAWPRRPASRCWCARPRATTIVIVETVGVGQSETAVAGMTDLFILLQLPNAGDDLQAIKKGVMELADLVVINKADLDEAAATRARAQITSALRLFGLPRPPRAPTSRRARVAPGGAATERAEGHGARGVLAQRAALPQVADRQWRAAAPPPCAGPGVDVGTHRSRPAPTFPRTSGRACGACPVSPSRCAPARWPPRWRHAACSN